MKIAAIQTDEALRFEFSMDVSMYTPEILIFLDETGSDRRNSLRKYEGKTNVITKNHFQR